MSSDSSYSSNVFSIIETVARRTATRLAGYFRNTFFDAEDLQQEGIRIALSAVSRWDENRGPLENYLSVAVKKELGNYVSKQLSVPSIGCNWTEARANQNRVPIIEGSQSPSDWEPLTSNCVDPEAACLAQERADRISNWRGKFRAVLSENFTDFSEHEWAMVLRLYGFDGHEEHKPREVAESLGVGITSVYRIHDKIRERLAYNPELWALSYQLKEIAPDGIEEVEQEYASIAR